MVPAVNPFAAPSLIAAPAILTNASAARAMSTSNRLAQGRACIAATGRS
jgi:hypothetical protein